MTVCTNISLLYPSLCSIYKNHSINQVHPYWSYLRGTIFHQGCNKCQVLVFNQFCNLWRYGTSHSDLARTPNLPSITISAKGFLVFGVSRACSSGDSLSFGPRFPIAIIANTSKSSGTSSVDFALAYSNPAMA